MFKNLDFDLDRAIFVAMFGTIAGIVAVDQIAPLKKMLPAAIGNNPQIAGPVVGGVAVLGDLGIRMAMAKTRGGEAAPVEA